MDIEHKLNVLSSIAEKLNSAKLTWAVGASLLLYFKGISDSFNDIDLMVVEADAERAKSLLLDMGQMQPPKPNGNYKTPYFYEFVIDGVEVDVMGGFIIVKDGQNYDCSLTRDMIVEHIVVNGQSIPLQAVSDWRRYYKLMGREAKVAMIDSAAACFIRKAASDDLSRVAEIFVFNNRINYFPIFRDAGFSFGELQVVSLIDNYFGKNEILENLYVYDSGLIKGFLQMSGTEISKLYVEPSFQSEGVGGALIEFAIGKLHASNLWALEKNARAISFYQRHGFHLTGQKKLEEDTTEYLVELLR